MGTATEPTCYDRAIHTICVGSPGRFVAGQDGWRDWAQAVLLSAQGDYRAGWQMLAKLRTDPDLALGGMSAAAQGSILRQLGSHTKAVSFDAQAVGAGGAAAIDGLTGLAADHIFAAQEGETDWLAKARILIQNGDAGALDSHPAVQRAELRLNWVTAERQLAQGDTAAAVRTATAGLDLAQNLGSPRHRLKSQLIAAVALQTLGHDVSDELTAVLREACALGIQTLVWPAGMVLGSRLAPRDRNRVQSALDFIGGHLPSGVQVRWNPRLP